MLDLAVITSVGEHGFVAELFKEALDHTDREWIGAIPDDILLIKETDGTSVEQMVVSAWPDCRVRKHG
jgi:hypothetical protein